jgi:hypothetical protein
MLKGGMFVYMLKGPTFYIFKQPSLVNCNLLVNILKLKLWYMIFMNQHQLAIGHMSTLIGATWSVTNLWFWKCLISKIILMLQVFNVFTS